MPARRRTHLRGTRGSSRSATSCRPGHRWRRPRRRPRPVPPRRRTRPRPAPPARHPPPAGRTGNRRRRSTGRSRARSPGRASSVRSAPGAPRSPRPCPPRATHRSPPALPTPTDRSAAPSGRGSGCARRSPGAGAGRDRRRPPRARDRPRPGGSADRRRASSADSRTSLSSPEISISRASSSTRTRSSVVPSMATPGRKARCPINMPSSPTKSPSSTTKTTRSSRRSTKQDATGEDEVQVVGVTGVPQELAGLGVQHLTGRPQQLQGGLAEHRPRQRRRHRPADGTSRWSARRAPGCCSSVEPYCRAPAVHDTCECWVMQNLSPEVPGRCRGRGHRRRARDREGARRAGWSPRERGSWSTTSTRTPAARWPRSSAPRRRPATAPPTPACARSSRPPPRRSAGSTCTMANAGIDRTQPDSLQASDEDWARMIDTNVMAHIRAARVLVPRWLEDGKGGRFVVTASAAGLLTMIGAAPYSVTKHAAVGFAEWLSVTYGHRGIAVQAICPAGRADPDARAGRAAQGPAHPRRRAHPRPGRRRVGGLAGRGPVPRPPPPRGRQLLRRPRRGPRRLAGRDAAAAGQGRRAHAEREP